MVPRRCGILRPEWCRWGWEVSERLDAYRTESQSPSLPQTSRPIHRYCRRALCCKVSYNILISRPGDGGDARPFYSNQCGLQPKIESDNRTLEAKWHRYFGGRHFSSTRKNAELSVRLTTYCFEYILRSGFFCSSLLNRPAHNISPA